MHVIVVFIGSKPTEIRQGKYQSNPIYCNLPGQNTATDVPKRQEYSEVVDYVLHNLRVTQP